MSSMQVLLILLSGLGVLHGVLLACFLWFYKGNQIANRILSLLLILLSFRIGKSVILEFVDGPHYTLIFIGLASLLLIGPVFYFYTRSVLVPSFRLVIKHLLHVIPFIPALIFSFWASEENVKATPVPFFIVLFCVYYGHYLLYLTLSCRLIVKAKKAKGSNKVAVEWLSIMVTALAVIWIVYVLNLLEDQIPYVLGPVLYSLIAYGVSFAAIKKGYLALLADKKYQTTPLSAVDVDRVFDRVKELITTEKLYKDPDLSLAILSKRLHVSPQKISMAINIKFQSNFNGFINQYRIQQARVLLKEEAFGSYSIAFIAYEVGFNSLTSFNMAFKKEMNTTPSIYRKEAIAG